MIQRIEVVGVELGDHRIADSCNAFEQTLGCSFRTVVRETEVVHQTQLNAVDVCLLLERRSAVFQRQQELADRGVRIVVGVWIFTCNYKTHGLGSELGEFELG
ncbi:hypothetical protein D3C85_872730 [compost metagenome]